LDLSGLIQSEHSPVYSVDTTLPEAVGWNRSTAHATIKVKHGVARAVAADLSVE
jgi:hypothetical protein